MPPVTVLFSPESMRAYGVLDTRDLHEIGDASDEVQERLAALGVSDLVLGLCADFDTRTIEAIKAEATLNLPAAEEAA